jgi:hypothetical protein
MNMSTLKKAVEQLGFETLGAAYDFASVHYNGVTFAGSGTTDKYSASVYCKDIGQVVRVEASKPKRLLKQLSADLAIANFENCVKIF